jgi:hypothetical protein
MPAGNSQPDSGSATETTTMPQINATALAWWAETAHGFQGERLAVVRRENADQPDIVPLSSVGPKDEVYFEVFTPEQSTLIRPEKLTLKAPNGPELDLLAMREADALFWTASAIEKFVFPYYYAQRLLSQDQMAQLLADYNSSRLVAILHVAPSKPYRIMEPFQVLAADGAGKASSPLQGLLQYFKSR